MDLIKELTKSQIKEMPAVEVGDTVKVHVKVKEGARERIQVYEGIVIAKKHGGIEETITVRRMSYGIGVEKVFPLHSPTIEKIEVVRHGVVRRAKLYYLRDRVGKYAWARPPRSARSSDNAKKVRQGSSLPGFLLWGLFQNLWQKERRAPARRGNAPTSAVRRSRRTP